MQHRRSLTVSLVVTLVLAIAVLIARDQLVTTGEADSAPAATTATATEIPLVNLVQTADGQQVVVPAGSLDQQEAAGVKVAIDVPRHLTATASRAMVEQTLRILLDNAGTYTHQGDIVTVVATREGARARLCVRDHGPGIAPADQPHVFDRFYRGDPARARHTGGSGLGLAIARSLVRAQGGEIALESEPGAGTCVCFTLPAAP